MKKKYLEPMSCLENLDKENYVKMSIDYQGQNVREVLTTTTKSHNICDYF